MENNITILVVDDDRNIQEILGMYLKKENFRVISCENGTDAVRVFREENPDLVLLDVMLPGMDGFAVLEEIRKRNDTPVIMLTAKGSTSDRIQGLENGADDYVSKPFDSKELVARIKAVLRRSVPTETEPEDDVVTFGGLSVSGSNYLVVIDGENVDMTPKEVELLHFFLTHPDRVFTREQLLKSVWDIDMCYDTRTVDVHVKRVREKLGPKYAAYIITKWAVGYKFDTTVNPE